MPTERTRVAIIGAGPSGLLLSWALLRAGIDSIVVERSSREHVLGRIRAGVLEQSSVELLTGLGLGSGVAERGLVHEGIYLQFEGGRHRVDFAALVDRTVTVYGQQQVVHDLVEAHEGAGSDIRFEASDVAVHDLATDEPCVTFVHDGAEHRITADLVIGADGFHGVCRPSIPDVGPGLTRDYPFAWLGILADVAPSTDELIYALHEDGFAMHSMRSPSVSRLYLQVEPDDSIENWSDARIWDGLHSRLGMEGWSLEEGPITEKSITPMRSFVAPTLRYGSLFLVGDSGHIVPPTGAKGLNSAFADVRMLADAIIGTDSRSGRAEALDRYSGDALARQWRTQQFSEWMTDLLHRSSPDSPSAAFEYRSQLGRLDYVTRSEHAMRGLAEQYTGMPF